MTFCYVADLFISIDRMPLLAPTLDIADPLFNLVQIENLVFIATGFLSATHIGGESRPN